MADLSANERRIPVYKLFMYREHLSRMDSFTDNVNKCNFRVRKGWSGKLYVEEHDLDDHKPELRADELFELYHVRPTDIVTLTENQFRDLTLVIEHAQLQK